MQTSACYNQCTMRVRAQPAHVESGGTTVAGRTVVLLTNSEPHRAHVCSLHTLFLICFNFILNCAKITKLLPFSVFFQGLRERLALNEKDVFLEAGRGVKIINLSSSR